MGVTSFGGVRGEGVGRRVATWGFVAALSWVGLTGCGVGELPSEEGTAPRTQAQAIESGNGLSLNGLSLNGLSLNGLSLNGLSLNGLSSPDFANWFNGNPAGNDQLMRYMVLCAVPAGESRSFLNPSTGELHTWEGSMGLTPAWAGGAPATVEEQQTLSACLAAHANNYGLHVSISVLGRDATGTNIPFTRDELLAYPVTESCFFGNVFTGEGLFAGNDRNSLAVDERTSRSCGLTLNGAATNADCPQMQRIDQCQDHCTLEPNGTFYTQCTFNGVRYKPLTTRLRTQDIYR